MLGISNKNMLITNQKIEQGCLEKIKISTKDYKAKRLYSRLSKAKTETKKKNIKLLIRQHFSTT
jgi:hypothetical protein